MEDGAWVRGGYGEEGGWHSAIAHAHTHTNNSILFSIVNADERRLFNETIVIIYCATICDAVDDV